MKMRNVCIALALLLPAAACNKDKTGKSVDRAADHVKDRVGDLRDEARDVNETSADRRGDLDDKANEVAKDTANDVKDLAKDIEKRSDRATDNAIDEANDLAKDSADRQDDIRDKARDVAKDVAGEAKDVGQEARKLRDENDEFKYRRLVRVQTLQGVLSVASAQPQLVNAFASNFAITDADKTMIDEKLQIFQNRIDDAANQIKALKSVDAQTWDQRHDDVNKAMDRVEDARKDAWTALKDAKRNDQTSMR
jgi:cyclophilin family peptidyl-prolyl cis-trans isomerase